MNRLMERDQNRFGGKALALLVAGVVLVGVWATFRPPSGPLQVIPDLNVEDPLVTCPGIPKVRYSRWIDLPSIDDYAHPAVDALRFELDFPGSEPLAQGKWLVIHIDKNSAAFVITSPNEYGYANFKRSGGVWRLGSYGLGRPCRATVKLPKRLNQVETYLDPDRLPDPDSINIHLLVTETACANGREMGDALLGPQVVETDTAVLVAYAAISLLAWEVDCPGNPSSRVSIELSRPLGNRIIYDGLYVPPKPLFPDAGTP